jgi:radical SAM superfamily enzyme YgiQ (UPF0313 family)
MSVQSCRGCPFDCEFCDVVALNGHKPRYKTPERFLAELDALRERGWRGQTFLVDDNFVGDPRRCKELLRAMIGWRRATGAHMTFLTEASVNMAEDPELLRLMVEAGFKKVFLGIETPSAESLQECHKMQNLRSDLQALARSMWRMGVRERGRRAYWCFLTSTLVRHPDRLGLAVTLAITGRHFRIVAEAL